MCLYGCERWDSNSRYPAYEAGDLTSCPLRNGCTRRIRTLSFGYEPNELPLLHQCYIKMGSYKVIPRTIWKEMKNRSKTYIWQDGESFIIVVCNPLWELPFGYSIPTRMTDVSGASNWIRTSGLPGMNRSLYRWAKEAWTWFNLINQQGVKENGLTRTAKESHFHSCVYHPQAASMVLAASLNLNFD